MKNLNKYKINGTFIKIALAIAIPLIFQQLITSSVNLIDNLMVGQLGDASLSGVASVNRFYLIAQFGIFGIAAASSIFIAQYYGAHKYDKSAESFRIGVLISSFIALFFFIITCLFPEIILRFFTKDQAILQIGKDYLKYAKYIFLPIPFTLMIASSMRAIGDVKTPLIASVTAVISNTLLNYCLIFGNFNFPKMGVSGAALATLAARLIELILLLVLLKINNYPFKTKIINIFNISSDLFKKVLLKALPLCGNEVLWSSGMAMIFKIYASRGTEVMTGYSISSTISDLFFVAFSGLAAVSTVLISQRLGANKLDEARENGYKIIGFSLML